MMTPHQMSQRCSVEKQAVTVNLQPGKFSLDGKEKHISHEVRAAPVRAAPAQSPERQSIYILVNFQGLSEQGAKQPHLALNLALL